MKQNEETYEEVTVTRDCPYCDCGRVCDYMCDRSGVHDCTHKKKDSCTECDYGQKTYDIKVPTSVIKEYVDTQVKEQTYF
jgi:hypothetical protein